MYETRPGGITGPVRRRPPATVICCKNNRQFDRVNKSIRQGVKIGLRLRVAIPDTVCEPVGGAFRKGPA